MTPILANIGLPMIFPQVILMGFAFIPIVLIESVLVLRALRLPVSRTLKDVALANLYTTIIGVPLAWLVMMVLGLVTTGGQALGLNSSLKMLAAVTLQSAWLIPYAGQQSWMIPCASTFLLFPCFIASVFVEARFLAKCWAEIERRRVYHAVLQANIWSYGALLVAGVFWIISRSS